MLTLMFYFCHHRYVNLDAHDKTALVSLSLTDEPSAVDVVRHSSRDKVQSSLTECFLTLQYFRILVSIDTLDLYLHHNSETVDQNLG